MTSHRWGEPDKDGVRACLRSGCTVRWCGRGGAWQTRKGRIWQRDTPYVGGRPSIPPCTGTDAQEAMQCAHDWVTECGVRYCRKCPALPPAPSPLEVVRAACAAAPHLVSDDARRVASEKALAALATLEESIRAEEREACARVADEAAQYMKTCAGVATDDVDRHVYWQRSFEAGGLATSIRARCKR